MFIFEATKSISDILESIGALDPPYITPWKLFVHVDVLAEPSSCCVLLLFSFTCRMLRIPPIRSKRMLDIAHPTVLRLLELRNTWGTYLRMLTATCMCGGAYNVVAVTTLYANYAPLYHSTIHITVTCS